MTLAPGVRLGPYEIVVLLGSGGMAEVYRARDVRLERDVALKILPEGFSDADALARFMREAKTASALNHPHLVTIHDIGEGDVNGRPMRYIAMELIHGESLRKVLEQASRDELLHHLANIADGLAKAHDASVVHRDLKPENVMVSKDGYAKVVDFGLAKHVPKLTDTPAEKLTSEGILVGTPCYMAPEQVRGERDIDGRADIFAFGCILYEAIAKRLAFDGESVVDAMYGILYREPPPLPDAAIDRIVRRCLAKDRASRYANMREVATAVRNAIATPVRRPLPRRLWLTAATLVMLAAGASGTFVALRGQSPAIESIAVLPFRNMSGNEEMRFLSDGIADEVVRDLGRVPSLRVIASSSSSRFRDVDPQEAARKLSVDAVLVGRLSAFGGAMHLDAELVRAKDGSALWGRRYSRNLTDVVSLEQEIANDLCDEIRVELAPVTRREPKPEAYDLYLRGKRELGKESGPGMKKGIEYFHSAIEIDPDYALPYAALANLYGRQGMLGLSPTRDSVLQQTALAEKALTLDPSLPEGHWNLGFAARMVGDKAEYERQAARTLQLNPNFAPAHLERANDLVLAKKFDEADVAYQKARSLDPLSPRLMTTYATYLCAMRQYDRCLTILRDVTVQYPDHAQTYPLLALYSSLAGRNDEALATLGAIPQARFDENPNILVWKSVIYARAGRMDEARQILARVEEVAKTRYMRAYDRASAHAHCGDREKALELIEKSYQDGEWLLSWASFEPSVDLLRGEPRFEAVIAARAARTGNASLKQQ